MYQNNTWFVNSPDLCCWTPRDSLEICILQESLHSWKETIFFHPWNVYCDFLGNPYSAVLHLEELCRLGYMLHDLLGMVQKLIFGKREEEPLFKLFQLYDSPQDIWRLWSFWWRPAESILLSRTGEEQMGWQLQIQDLAFYSQNYTILDPASPCLSQWQGPYLLFPTAAAYNIFPVSLFSTPWSNQFLDLVTQDVCMLITCFGADWPLLEQNCEKNKKFSLMQCDYQDIHIYLKASAII